MPWTAWPGGSFSWGYNPFALFAAEDRYLAEAGGDPLRRLDRLKRLVTELHRRGMHVLMDGVFNHVESSRVPTAPRTAAASPTTGSTRTRPGRRSPAGSPRAATSRTSTTTTAAPPS